jgi:hypothetical protein
MQVCVSPSLRSQAGLPTSPGQAPSSSEEEVPKDVALAGGRSVGPLHHRVVGRLLHYDLEEGPQRLLDCVLLCTVLPVSSVESLDSVIMPVMNDFLWTVSGSQGLICSGCHLLMQCCLPVTCM